MDKHIESASTSLKTCDKKCGEIFIWSDISKALELILAFYYQHIVFALKSVYRRPWETYKMFSFIDIRPILMNHGVHVEKTLFRYFDGSYQHNI